MFGTHDLALFILSGLLLNISPGPDSLLVVSSGASRGWRAGAAVAAGIGIGMFVHIFAAAAGLSAILASSTKAFTIVKYLGAAYLLYIGIMNLRKGKECSSNAQKTRNSSSQILYWRFFLDGFLTNALNPKIAIFFLAFVPQFISADTSDKASALIFLGCIFNVGGFIWNNILAIFSSVTSRHLQVEGLLASSLKKLTGLLFISLGIKLALTQQTV